VAQITVIANNKGGVGKTLVCKKFAEYLAMEEQQKVLLIDLDPQTNLSRRHLDMELGGSHGEDYSPPLHPEYEGEDDWDGYSDSADIWLGAFAAPYPTGIQNIEILPGHADKLAKIELVREKEVYEQVIKRLDDYLHLDDIQNEYDHILIDTRPSKGPLVQAALTAANFLIVPTEMESPSVEGLYGMIWLRSQVNRKRSKTNQLKMIGILPNKYRNNLKLHQEFRDFLTGDDLLGDYILPHAISDWVGYKEAMLPKAKSIFEYSENDKHRKELVSIFGDLYSRIQGEVAHG